VSAHREVRAVLVHARAAAAAMHPHAFEMLASSNEGVLWPKSRNISTAFTYTEQQSKAHEMNLHA